jgi:hypothetical protein
MSNWARRISFRKYTSGANFRCLRKSEIARRVAADTIIGEKGFGSLVWKGLALSPIVLLRSVLPF